MSEHLWGLASPKGVNLDAISRGGIPEMTAEDLAIACKGLQRLPFAAALYSLAGDDSMWARLRTGLLEHLLLERDTHQWAHKVERITGERSKFAEELVGLFLAEERRPAPFQSAPHLRAVVLRIEPETWRKSVLHQFQAVASEYARWLLEAEDHVRRKMRRNNF